MNNFDCELLVSKLEPNNKEDKSYGNACNGKYKKDVAATVILKKIINGGIVPKIGERLQFIKTTFCTCIVFQVFYETKDHHPFISIQAFECDYDDRWSDPK